MPDGKGISANGIQFNVSRRTVGGHTRCRVHGDEAQVALRSPHGAIDDYEGRANDGPARVGEGLLNALLRRGHVCLWRRPVLAMPYN